MTTIKELIDLRGRRALITGAAGGLGCVMADTLAELGADLILVDRPGAGVACLREDFRARWDVDVMVYDCDLEIQDQRQNLIDDIRRRNEYLNVLLNNAAFVGTSGLNGWAVPFADQTVETWRRAIEVNLTAPFHLSQGLIPLLRCSEGASIINIGSIYGEHGPDWRLYEGTAMSNPAAYSVSKAGLSQLTRWLATTVAPHVRVNLISPGGVFRNQPEVFVDRYRARTPLGRMAAEGDFAGAVAFLASDLSRYITGQTVSVDGGWGVW